ncbi:MAG: hypothetical protein ACRDK2_10370 [Solirubrobacteraceae bacterium]
MGQDRARYGALVSAIGAAVLAVSVFLPWYGLSLTASGVQSAQQGLNAAAEQYGNTAFQSEVSGLSASFGSLAGHQLGTVSAHDVLKYLDSVLVILAAIGLVAALLRLADAARGPGQIALVGLLASLAVLFRILDSPAPQQTDFRLSLSWGIWLALAGSVAMIVGDLWPRGSARTELSGRELAKALEGLSAWTPEG